MNSKVDCTGKVWTEALGRRGLHVSIGGGGLVEVNEPGEFLAATEYRHPLVVLRGLVAR